MKKQYVLDLTKAELPSWWPKGGPVILPVVKSKHQYDWDLIPEKLPAPFYAAIKKVVIKRFKSQGLAFDERLPIGFRNNTWPTGGVVRLA